jgi:hypothetical protein
VKIPVQVSPSAAARLTRAEIRLVVRRARGEAESLPDWRPGKSYRLNFTKAGQGFTVALDNRADGILAFVGLAQAITREPAKRRYQRAEVRFDDGSPSGALSTWRVTATDQDGHCTHENISVGFCESADEARRRAARLLGIPGDSIVVIR